MVAETLTVRRAAARTGVQCPPGRAIAKGANPNRRGRSEPARPDPAPAPLPQRGHKPTRASARLQGVEPEYAETIDIDDRPYEQLEDLLANDDVPVAQMTEEQRQELQERRCGSQGRGSIYDSSLGGWRPRAGVAQCACTACFGAGTLPTPP